MRPKHIFLLAGTGIRTQVSSATTKCPDHLDDSGSDKYKLRFEFFIYTLIT